MGSLKVIFMNINDQGHFHYEGCGLPNVWLTNGFTIIDAPEGKFYQVQHHKKLHQQIGLALTNKTGRLSPAEFWFLRTEMGLSRSKLGELFEYSSEAIKKWENGTNPIHKLADAQLRHLYLARTNHDHIKLIIEMINSNERNEIMLSMSNNNGEWDFSKAS